MRLIDADELSGRFKELKGADSLANMFITDVIKVIKAQPAVNGKGIEKAIETLNPDSYEGSEGSKPRSQWMPADKPPGNDGYIVMSFENFSIPLVGQYREDEEGGAFYIGDDEESCISQGLIVNGWMPLPEPYREDAGEMPEYD